MQRFDFKVIYALEGLSRGWFYKKKRCPASLNLRLKIHTHNSRLSPQRGEPLDQQVITHEQGVEGHLATVVGYAVANNRVVEMLYCLGLHCSRRQLMNVRRYSVKLAG